MSAGAYWPSGYMLGPDTCKTYGCVRCQLRHYEYEGVYEEHLSSQSKHGIQVLPIPVMSDADAVTHVTEPGEKGGEKK